MAKLKVGIIGLGGIARAHCSAIDTLDNVEVVAVADLFEEKRREYMQKNTAPHAPLQESPHPLCAPRGCLPHADQLLL